MAVYSDFGGALAEARRGQYDWWNRRNEAPDGPDCFAARAEAYRLRGLALHALFRVQLVAGSQRGLFTRIIRYVNFTRNGGMST